MEKKVIERAKMSLCQYITSCDGPMFLPCGHKKQRSDFCERWKHIKLQKGDFTVDGDGFMWKNNSIKRIRKEFLKYINRIG